MHVFDQLTDLEVKRAKPEAKPYRLSDGGGLFLLITPEGSKLWRWKYRFKGRERLMAFGLYPDIPLAEARTQHKAARQKLAKGQDPLAEKIAVRSAEQVAREHSFQIVAEAWYENWQGNKDHKTRKGVTDRLEKDLYPRVGKRSIAEINAPEWIQLAKGIENRGALEQARKALGIAGRVYSYAVANKMVERNPIRDIEQSQVLKPRTRKNHARIDARDLPTLLRKMESDSGKPLTKLAMKLLCLTFTRTRELQAAKWSEFDLDAARWVIPAERMKPHGPKGERTAHIVPLSPQAIAVLKELWVLTGTGELVFPNVRDPKKPMAFNTLLRMLERMGFGGEMTGHGFRGLAATIMNEHDHVEAHIDAQLAHVKRDQVSGAYNHAKYVKQRTALMLWWGDYVERQQRGKVITMRAS